MAGSAVKKKKAVDQDVDPTLATTNVRVAVRCRPFNEREHEMDAGCCLQMDGKTTTITHPVTGKDRSFTFDYSYWSFDHASEDYASQDTVFLDLGMDILENAWAGYNVSLFAYGQTGSGKSYSMVGWGEDEGVIPRVCNAIFQRVEGNNSPDVVFSVEVSMLEIYNERVRDLFNPAASRSGLRVRTHPQTGPYVDGLRTCGVRSYEDVSRLMEKGTQARTVASTNMNATSSRAHTIFTLNITQTFLKEGEAGEMSSKINLVDLAGSERSSATEGLKEEARMKEGININKSLSALGNCIQALAEQSNETKPGKKKMHVPYRDSVLTLLLKESLGGNSKTIMIAALSPASINYDETLNTLRYADRAKRIKTKAVVNEDANDKLISMLQDEIRRLRSDLEQRPAADEPPEEREARASEAAVLREQLAQSEEIMTEMQRSWEEKLRATQEAAAAQEAILRQVGVGGNGAPGDPHLVNLNEDPVMSECLVYFLAEGETRVGQPGRDNQIQLTGVSIRKAHCTLHTRADRAVFLRSMKDDEPRVYVNGEKLRPGGAPRRLQHGDRVVMGSHHVFRFSDGKADKDELQAGDVLSLSRPQSAMGMTGSRPQTAAMAGRPRSAKLPQVKDWAAAQRELVEAEVKELTRQADKRYKEQLQALQQKEMALSREREELERTAAEKREKESELLQLQRGLAEQAAMLTEAEMEQLKKGEQLSSAAQALARQRKETESAHRQMAEKVTMLEEEQRRMREEEEEKREELRKRAADLESLEWEVAEQSAMARVERDRSMLEQTRARAVAERELSLRAAEVAERQQEASLRLRAQAEELQAEKRRLEEELAAMAEDKKRMQEEGAERKQQEKQLAAWGLDVESRERGLLELSASLHAERDAMEGKLRAREEEIAAQQRGLAASRREQEEGYAGMQAAHDAKEHELQVAAARLVREAEQRERDLAEVVRIAGAQSDRAVRQAEKAKLEEERASAASQTLKAQQELLRRSKKDAEREAQRFVDDIRRRETKLRDDAADLRLRALKSETEIAARERSVEDKRRALDERRAAMDSSERHMREASRAGEAELKARGMEMAAAWAARQQDLEIRDGILKDTWSDFEREMERQIAYVGRMGDEGTARLAEAYRSKRERLQAKEGELAVATEAFEKEIVDKVLEAQALDDAQRRALREDLERHGLQVAAAWEATEAARREFEGEILAKTLEAAGVDAGMRERLRQEHAAEQEAMATRHWELMKLREEFEGDLELRLLLQGHMDGEAREEAQRYLRAQYGALSARMGAVNRMREDFEREIQLRLVEGAEKEAVLEQAQHERLRHEASKVAGRLQEERESFEREILGKMLELDGMRDEDRRKLLEEFGKRRDHLRVMEEEVLRLRKGAAEDIQQHISAAAHLRDADKERLHDLNRQGLRDHNRRMLDLQRARHEFEAQLHSRVLQADLLTAEERERTRGELMWTYDQVCAMAAAMDAAKHAAKNELEVSLLETLEVDSELRRGLREEAAMLVEQRDDVARLRDEVEVDVLLKVLEVEQLGEEAGRRLAEDFRSRCDTLSAKEGALGDLRVAFEKEVLDKVMQSAQMEDEHRARVRELYESRQRDLWARSRALHVARHTLETQVEAQILEASAQDDEARRAMAREMMGAWRLLSEQHDALERDRQQAQQDVALLVWEGAAVEGQLARWAREGLGEEADVLSQQRKDLARLKDEFDVHMESEAAKVLGERDAQREIERRLQRQLLEERIIRLIHLSNEANEMTEQLGLPVHYGVKVVSRDALSSGEVASDAGRGPPKMDVAVTVVREDAPLPRPHTADRRKGMGTGGLEPSLWSDGKFEERIAAMREQYQDFIAGVPPVEAGGEDAFVDEKPPARLIGTARVYTEPIAYLLHPPDDATLLDPFGRKQGKLLVTVRPCAPYGGETELDVDEPEDLVGEALHYLVEIRGASDLRTAYCRGVHVAYTQSWGGGGERFVTAPCPDASSEPRVSYTRVHAVPVVTRDFVQVLEEGTLIFEVLGYPRKTLDSPLKQAWSMQQATLPTASGSRRGLNFDASAAGPVGTLNPRVLGQVESLRNDRERREKERQQERARREHEVRQGEMRIEREKEEAAHESRQLRSLLRTLGSATNPADAGSRPPPPPPNRLHACHAPLPGRGGRSRVATPGRGRGGSGRALPPIGVPHESLAEPVTEVGHGARGFVSIAYPIPAPGVVESEGGALAPAIISSASAAGGAPPAASGDARAPSGRAQTGTPMRLPPPPPPPPVMRRSRSSSASPRVSSSPDRAPPGVPKLRISESMGAEDRRWEPMSARAPNRASTGSTLSARGSKATSQPAPHRASAPSGAPSAPLECRTDVDRLAVVATPRVVGPAAAGEGKVSRTCTLQ